MDLRQSAMVTQGQVCRWAFCWHGGVTDERDATRTSRMGIWTTRSLTDEIQKNYGYHSRMNFPEKSSMFDFSVMA